MATEKVLAQSQDIVVLAVVALAGALAILVLVIIRQPIPLQSHLIALGLGILLRRRTVEKGRKGLAVEIRYVLEKVHRSLVATAAGIGTLGSLELGLQAATPALVVGQQLVAARHSRRMSGPAAT